MHNHSRKFQNRSQNGNVAKCFQRCCWKLALPWPTIRNEAGWKRHKHLRFSVDGSIAPKSTVGIAYWMQRVIDECDRVNTEFAPDPVHDLRVALRRCRSMADGMMVIDPSSSWREMKRAIRRLFRGL